MWVLTLKCFPPLTTSFMINSVNMVRCIRSAYLCPSLLPFTTGASSPQLEQMLVWCGEAWGRGHHTAHNSKCGRCLLITFCGRLWLWKKVWGRWAKDYTGENWSGARTVGTVWEKKRGLMDGVWSWAPQGPPVLLSAASGSSGWFSSARSSSSSSWFSGTFLGRRIGENLHTVSSTPSFLIPTPLLPAWQFSV